MSARILLACENRTKGQPYLEALRLLGAPGDSLELLVPAESPRDLCARAAAASGLILCGGPDLDPRHYGQAPLETASLHVVPELDAMDLELLRGAYRGNTPVWAICRGMQTVNVFQGGTLWQDLPTQVGSTIEHDPRGPHAAITHTVVARESEERFGELLNGTRILVNSRHHQAVRDLGRDLIAVATSPDGLIEVIALRSTHWWVKGVQWHPEDLMHFPLQRLLWSEFLTAVAHRAGRGRKRGEPGEI